MAKRGVSPLRLELFVIVLCSLLQLSVQESWHTTPDRCIWYDTCGTYPCAYNGIAKPLTERMAQRVLYTHCPDFYPQSGATPLTCCSPRQLSQLADQMVVADQIFSICPSCFHNFLNLYCYLTCSPNQNRFLHVNQTTPTPEANAKNTVAVTAVDYLVSSDFADGLFNSCKNVHMPTGELALNAMCGVPAAKCTPKRLLEECLDFGPISVKSVNFKMSDNPWRLPDGTTLHPMNATLIPCSSPVGNSSSPCRCEDCALTPCTTTPPPLVPVFPCAKTFTKHWRLYSHSQGYKALHLIVQRRGPHPRIAHLMPPPSSEVVMFTDVFNKSFLHQVLDFQNAIAAKNFSIGSTSVSLRDVCWRAAGSQMCSVLSVLQYYQDSHHNLNKTVRDEFFTYADYLDHLLFCVRSPNSTRDATKLNMSCVSDFGGPVMPQDVFCGYDGEYFQNATSLVITYLIKDPIASKAAMIWRDGLLAYIIHFMTSHPDFIINTFE